MELTTDEFKRCNLVKTTDCIDSQTALQLEEAFRAITEHSSRQIFFGIAVASLFPLTQRPLFATLGTSKSEFLSLTHREVRHRDQSTLAGLDDL
jgi:hypothetical protein